MAGGFVRHRGLIAFAAGGAMAEAMLLTYFAPSARSLAPQVTALPPLAAYHDLRWLFAFNQSWLGFTGVLLLLVVARSAVDAVLVMLAWPRGGAGDEHSLPRPRFMASLVSCAMLARHPHLPVRSVVLLSPIVQPGQLGQAGGTVPGAALTTLNNLIGGMSPYGSSGAQELINSVSEVGGRYFERVSRDRGLSWLAVVPLADAVTLPACPMPQNVIFVDAFHGGLLGDPSVQRIVAAFLAGGTPSDQDLDAMAGGSQRDLRSAASLTAAAAAAWRMPDLQPACLSS